MPEYKIEQNTVRPENIKHKKRKRQKNRKVFFIILPVILLFTVIPIILYKLWVRPPDIMQFIPTESGVRTSENMQESAPDISAEIYRYTRKELCYTFLIAASDQSSGNADVIMVMTYDAGNKKIGLVSVPRDTLIERDYPKINTVYHTGVEALRNTVSDMLGIPIDFFVTVNVSGFVKLADTVGGVDFDVPCKMDYDDPFQDLSIHFEAGMQHLDGEEILKICRWRKNNDGTGYIDSDIGRTKTQHALIKAVIKKVMANPQKITAYPDIFAKSIKTDLPFGNMVWFAQNALSMDLNTEENIRTATLPGNGDVSYNGYTYCYQLYPDEVLEIVNHILNPYTEDITSADMNIFEAS